MRALPLLALATLSTACGNDRFSNGTLIDGILLPDVTQATFVDGIDNPFLPWPVGASWTYEAETPEGSEVIVVSVTSDTKQIQGVTATVVRDTVTVDSVLVEDTTDWYAQDTVGNVWYLGEDTCVFEDGQCVDKEGSWEWGVDGALPGFAMPATPEVDGQPYYQEYYPGHAEDVGEVVDVDATADVPAGSFTDCVRTHDTSTLDLDLDEHKTYCRDVGVVRVDEPDATEELTAYTAP